MRKYFLILGLIFTLAPALAEEFVPVASTPVVSGGYSNRYNRPYHNHNHNHWNNGWNNWNRPNYGWNRPNYGWNRPGYNWWNRPMGGTLTGYSPSINYGYNPGYSQTFTTNNGYYTSNPYLSDNVSLGTKIKRFFNPNYSNHYLNSPNYNPYQAGNYNNLNNNRSIPLYGNDPDGSSSGATVTIID